MKIGVVGIGVVGGAVAEGFERLGHDVKKHDIRFDTTIVDVIETEICFICVPTPSKETGECDIDIVKSIVSDLNIHEYDGIVAIKSTVMPGTIDKFSEKYPNLQICFVPEFLRERCAVEDFIENHDLCVVGTHKGSVFEKVKDCHGHYPEKFAQLRPIEAETIKYFNNVYNATLITFANCFYRVCNAIGADYMQIKNTIVNREHINDVYLNCSEEFRGFGGPCLPKDTRAMAYLVKNLDLDVDFFETLLNENSKYKTTVYDGMRQE